MIQEDLHEMPSGRMGFEDTVQGKLVSECLGKERQLHEGVAQVQLRGSLNVHGSLSQSKKEKAESLIEHDSFSYAKKEKVESSLNDVADISKETKSAAEKAKSVSDAGVIKCNKNTPMGSDSERVGVQFHEDGVQGVYDRGPSSPLKVNSPWKGCLDSGALSESEEARVFQSALPNSLRNRGELNTCSQEGGYEGVVDGCDSIQTSFVSRVEDSLGIRPSLDEVEQSGVRVVEERDVGCLRTLVNVHPKILVIHGLLDNRDFDMLDEVEEARGLEVPTSGECGRACPPGSLSAGLGAGLEGGAEGGGNNVFLKGRSAGWAGEVEGKHPSVDQVFLVHQTGSSSNSLFTSDSAIENCNRIFWVKTDKNVATRVWGVGKEAGFSFLGREDVVVKDIYSLSNQGGVTTRRMWKERSKFVNEDS